MEILHPVHSDHSGPGRPVTCLYPVTRLCTAGLGTGPSGAHRFEDGVTGLDHDPALDALIHEVGSRPGVRCEQHVGQPPHRHPDDLLGERMKPAMGTQARLHVGQGQTGPFGHQRAQQSRRCIAMDHAHSPMPGEHATTQPGR